MDRGDIYQIKINRLSEWMKTGRAGPVKIDIEPTNTCNLNCKFCWTQSRDRLNNCQYDEILTAERILSIIDEAAELGVVEWQIAGGWEPTVNRDLLIEMAKRIKSYGMYGCITTNGTLFTDEMIETFVSIGWDEILFSLEGANPETHDYLTGINGSFYKSTSAMETFKKVKEKYGKSTPNYSFHAVLTNKNYKQLEEMIRLGKKIGCTGVNFEPLTVWSDIGKNLKLNENEMEDVKKYARDAIKTAKKLGIHTTAENLLDTKLVKKDHMDEILINEFSNMKKDKDSDSILNSPCFEPWLSLEIRVNGRVAPCRICDFDSNCETVQNKSLKDVWEGEYFQNLRKKMVSGHMPKFCTDCAAGNVVTNLKMKRDIIENNKVFSISKIKNMVRAFYG